MNTSNQCYIFFFQAEDGIRDGRVTGVQTCALPISNRAQPASVAVAAAEAGWARLVRNRPAPVELLDAVLAYLVRSEERRVGKEGRSRWSSYNKKKYIDGGSWLESVV